MTASNRSISITTLFFLFCSVVVGAKSTTEKHREHSTHQHGAGKMGIAFDGSNGKIDLKIPSESVFGFEHEARTDQEKSQLQEALKKLEARISEMVVFAPTIKCLVTKDKIQVVPEDEGVGNKNKVKGEHSETVATFNVLCEKSPAGTRLTFNIQKFFPQIKDMDVDILVGTTQAAVEAKKNGVTVDLLDTP